MLAIAVYKDSLLIYMYVYTFAIRYFKQQALKAKEAEDSDADSISDTEFDSFLGM